MSWVSGKLKDLEGNQLSNKTKASDIILDDGQTLEEFLEELENRVKNLEDESIQIGN